MKTCTFIFAIILLLTTGCQSLSDIISPSKKDCACPMPPETDEFQIRFENALGKNLLSSLTPNYFHHDSTYVYKTDDSGLKIRLDSLYFFGTSDTNYTAISIKDFGYDLKKPYTESYPLYLYLNATDTDTIQIKFDLNVGRTFPNEIWYNGVYQPASEKGGPIIKIVKNI